MSTMSDENGFSEDILSSEDEMGMSQTQHHAPASYSTLRNKVAIAHLIRCAGRVPYSTPLFWCAEHTFISGVISTS